MSTEVDKTWINFLEWLYKAHNITKDWKPDRTSIKLWEEFNKRVVE